MKMRKSIFVLYRNKEKFKTKKLAFRSSNEFKFISEEIIEFGGKLSFLWMKRMYI